MIYTVTIGTGQAFLLQSQVETLSTLAAANAPSITLLSDDRSRSLFHHSDSAPHCRLLQTADLHQTASTAAAGKSPSIRGQSS